MKKNRINYNYIIDHNNFWTMPLMSFKNQRIVYLSRGKTTHYFIALVQIESINTGEHYDIISGTCADRPIMKKYCKRFVVHSPQARQQIYTLRRKQYAILYGVAVDTTSKIFYVRAIWGSYIPSTYEIKNDLRAENKDITKLLETEKEKQETQDFLDEIMKRKEDIEL